MKKRILFISISTLLLGACNLAPDYRQPEVRTAPQFNHNSEGQYHAHHLGWQDYFADPRLHTLIELALENNPDLRIAALNAEAVRAQYAITRAASLPGINASGTGQRVRSAADLSPTGRSGISETYNVGLGIASYEIDLFGKLRNNNHAALQNYFASQANRDAAQLSLIASVAKAYFNERYAQESIKLTENILATRQESQKLYELQHRAGVISALNLREIEGLIESARADHAAAQRAREQARNALNVLINRPLPEGLPEGLPLNKQFNIERLPAGLPAEVLQNRPDIRAAEHGLRQANANIGAARAAFFPSITLTSTIGSGSTQLDRLFTGTNATWSFVPTINLPIFNWGRLSSSLDVAEIRKDIAVATYEKTVQAAFQDIANALTARETLQQQYEAQLRTQGAYNDRLRLVHLRYRHGASDSLDVHDAERSSYTADTATLSTQRLLLENMADVYKALGGGLHRHSQAPQNHTTP